jgi:Fe2+ or Zn2+ uptake regulation protein
VTTRDVLRRAGLRATVARIAVLDHIDATPVAHADLFAILAEDHDRTTIFRTLATLTRAKVVRRIELGDRVWRYQRMYAIAASFLCVACKRVIALPGFAIKTPTGPRSIARREVEITVRGRCDRCL